MTNEVGTKRGRPILLCARIMAKPEQNMAIGLDPFTWANENLLDFVIVSHYLHNNFSLPIQEYKKLFPKEYPIYASIEVEREEETFRDIAQQLWQDEVDGISLFNFFTSRERGKEPLFNIIPEIGTPQIISHISAPEYYWWRFDIQERRKSSNHIKIKRRERTYIIRLTGVIPR